MIESFEMEPLPLPVPDNVHVSRSRRRWVFAGCGLLAVVLIALLPSIIAATPLRNSLASGLLGVHGLNLSIGSASAGWLSSVRAESVELIRNDGSLRLSVPHVETQFSLADLLASAPDFGDIRLERPHLELTIRSELELPDFDEFPPAQTPGHRATLNAAIEQAEVVIRLGEETEPAIHVDGLTTALRLEEGSTGRQLVADPLLLMDHVTLTPEVCRQGLQFVAPLLADTARVAGDFSLEVREFRIPIDERDPGARQQATSITGRVTLHRVETGLRNPILARIAELIARLTGGRQPQLVQVLDDTLIDFEFRDGGIYHEGLAIVLPDVSRELEIRSRGRVGLDEQIDIELLVSLPSELTRSIPVLRRLTAEPLLFRLTGTLDEPHLQLPEGRDLLDELAGRLLDPSEINSPPKSIEGAIRGLLHGLTSERDRQPDVEQTASGILNLIQSIRDRNKPNDQRDVPESRSPE